MTDVALSPSPSPAQSSVPFRLKHVTAPDASTFQPIEVPDPARKGNPNGGATKSPKPALGGALNTVRRAFTTSKKSKRSEHSPDGRAAAENTQVANVSSAKSDVDHPAKTTFVRSVSTSLSNGLHVLIKHVPSGKSSASKLKEKSQSRKERHPLMVQKEAGIRYSEPNRYFIEYITKPDEPLNFGEEENAGMRHGVMIHHCEDCVINVQRKVNKIEIDSCKRVTVILPAVLSAVDIQHSSSCTIKVLNRCPGISIDECQSLSIYIPRENMDLIEVASSGGGSANILVAREDDPSEYQEYPIPFQFVHKFKDAALVSEVSPLYTH